MNEQDKIKSDQGYFSSESDSDCTIISNKVLREIEEIESKGVKMIDEKHKWYKTKYDFIACKKCTIIKVGEGANKSCKGSAKIDLRRCQIELKDHSGKIHTIEPIDQGDYKISSEKQSVCSVCYQTYPIDFLPDDFLICCHCELKNLKPNSCLDKNGAKFFPGNYLKNEASSATVQILKISDTHIYDDKNGATEKEDFVCSSWIVHERVTKYTGKELCKFQWDRPIGSIWCASKCDHNKGGNLKHQWVTCELYNKENEK